jgi:hypothetical protein
MEEIRERPKKIGVDRAFETGRLGPTEMAAAYERLVPIHRMPLYREPKVNRQDVREECVCAR